MAELETARARNQHRRAGRSEREREEQALCRLGRAVQSEKERRDAKRRESEAEHVRDEDGVAVAILRRHRVVDERVRGRKDTSAGQHANTPRAERGRRWRPLDAGRPCQAPLNSTLKHDLWPRLPSIYD